MKNVNYFVSYQLCTLNIFKRERKNDSIIAWPHSFPVPSMCETLSTPLSHELSLLTTLIFCDDIFVSSLFSELEVGRKQINIIL